MSYTDKVHALQSELNDRIRNKGNNHPLVAETLSSLGLFYCHMIGDQDKAILTHYSALKIPECQEPSEEIFLKRAFSLVDMGYIFWKTGYHALAKSKYLSAFAFFQQSLINECYPQAKLCKYAILRGLAHLNESPQ